ncbi:uncharacterized protein STEHIDRAFT_81994 [Stereum hirsutum FP-91666 SS1]|uniref:uncharacterized protein n=1 Tax=Stereum hirsutum (strain FP-91666) TaxID=721885 RepID=UPI0004449720|nr:uncharacterized protein STEHIDRAFT_81994 [Stereum hirsutum FP-91666 SS1]EIM85126.1 hypothetical protein STEHIDRAFT_81994 [Stereum hirsutum FP-91666 SS1]
MSKSSTASAPKIPLQLPTKSAWARGPPQNTTASSSRSQSPAPSTVNSPTTSSNPHASHSRRPSTLGQGVSIKEGVTIPRNTIPAASQSSPVTFGSIHDADAPISSSPASAPPVKAENPKSFGSIVADQNGSANKSVVTNRPASMISSTPTSATPASAPSTVSQSHAAPKLDRKSIAKLFQTASSPSPSPSVTDASPSPSTRPLSLPPQPHQSGPPPGQQYNNLPPPFTPSNMRPPQNGNVGPPRSPVFARQTLNGTSGGVGVSGRTPPGPGGPAAGPGAMSGGMPSPRLAPHHPHVGQPAGMPPQPIWPGYYYGYVNMPQEGYYPTPPWATQPLPPQHQPPPQQHHQHGQPMPPNTMPMSPRNPPPPLQQGPGTPTQSHAVLSPPHHNQHPHPSPHLPPSNLTSPPPTPSSSSSQRLNTNANAFVPSKKIVLKDPNGQEVNLEALRKSGSQFNGSNVVVPQPPGSPGGFKKESRRSPSVRIESEAQKQLRLEAEQKKTAEEQDKVTKEKEREEKARKEKEEKERRETEEKERKVKEEKEAAEKKERERLVEEERKRKEEEERVRKEEEEKKQAEEAAEAERKRVEEELAEKARLEEEDRVKKAKEEEEAKLKELEAAEKAEAEAAAKAAAAASEKEEGEIEESKPSESSKAADAAELAAAAEEARDKVPDKEPLRIDTAAVPELPGKRRPGPLNLQSVQAMNIPQPLPSALATARIIEDLHEISYPEGIKSPKVELNANAAKGKFRYDRDFLLQFMAVCKEKPDNLPPLDAIGLEPSDQTSSGFSMTRGGSGRRNSGMVTPSGSVSRNASIGLGFVPSSMGKSSGFAMGQFATTAKTSEERFALANGPSRSTSLAGSALSGIAMGGGRGPPMSRTNSQGGPGSGKERERTRSKRSGQTRNESNRVHISTPAMSNMGPPLEPVAPLEASANRWVAGSTRRGAAAAAVTPDPDSPEMVERKVKGLLNKLTMERFDSISEQIISWANKSETEKDGRTLIQVIKLVFEKATDEAAFSEMYARLCRKMMETISPKVQDDGIKNQEGKPIAGGQLFRKYLLNRCQEDFERGWLQKETSAAAALTKATEDEAAARANTASGKEAEEGELYSDEYYAAQKAKRRGLGLIRFIGELFKLQMLTERIMHECIKKLLGNVENPEEEEIESLCKLMTTVGAILDTQKAHAHMDVYFARMKELTKSPNVNSRMAFMLQDVIELRERRWLVRNAASGPLTISQVHEAAAKDQAAKEKESYQRQMSMSRGGSRRGGDRGEPQQIGPDGWAIASGPNRPPPKAGDLSHFGKIAKSTPMTFGPSSVFAGKKEAKGREAPLSRTASTSNMFSMLSQNPELAVEATTSKPSRPASRKTSVDLTQSGGVPESTQRRKLQLLPRSKALEETKAEDSTPAGSEAGSEDGRGETPAPPSMSEEAATNKIAEDVKEFFGIRMLGEAESYFSSLPEEHRFRLVDKLVTTAIESKAADAQLVADLFAQARERDLCSPASFEEGFLPLAELLDDIAIDAPKAFDLFANMMKGAGLDKDEERRTRIAEKSMDKDKLIALLA